MSSSGRQLTSADILDGTTWEQVGATKAGDGISPIISFTGFGTTWSELLVLIRGNVTGSATAVCGVNFESTPTAAAYYYQRIYGAGTTVAAQESLAGASGSLVYLFSAPAASGTGSQPSMQSTGLVHLPNYSSSSYYKTVFTRGLSSTGLGSGQFANDVTIGFFASVAVISLIRVICLTGNWTTATTVQLLGR